VWLHHKIGKKIKNKNKEAIPENFSGEKSFSILFVFERQYGRGITQVVHAASVFCIIMHQLKHRVARKFHLGGGGGVGVVHLGFSRAYRAIGKKTKNLPKPNKMYSLSYDCLHTRN
jgi:hypothetical protein